jgi:hypothetical protein
MSFAATGSGVGARRRINGRTGLSVSERDAHNISPSRDDVGSLTRRDTGAACIQRPNVEPTGFLSCARRQRSADSESKRPAMTRAPRHSCRLGPREALNGSRSRWRARRCGPHRVPLSGRTFVESSLSASRAADRLEASEKQVAVHAAPTSRAVGLLALPLAEIHFDARSI